MKAWYALALGVAVQLTACDSPIGPPPTPSASEPTKSLEDAVPQATWTVMNLGVLQGGTFSEAFGINDAGEVAGYGDWDDPPPGCGAQSVGAFLYTGGSLRPIYKDYAHYCLSESAALDVNNASSVVGWLRDFGTSNHAFLWTAGTGLQLITTPGGDAFAFGINNAGTVVGSFQPPPLNDNHAFQYSPGSGLVDAQPAGPYIWSKAYDINDAGVIVGQIGSQLATWTLGGPVFFLGVDQGTDYGSFFFPIPPLGVGASGAVVGGYHDFGSQKDVAFRWVGGVLKTLASPGNATDISSKGRVVGWQQGASTRRAASGTTAVQLLTSLAPGRSAVAAAVNTCGDVAGYSENSSGSHRAVRWKIAVCDP